MKLNIRHLCMPLIFLIAMVGGAQAQQGKFVKKTMKFHWSDQLLRPWNDLTCKMAIRIDPFDIKDLGLPQDEIASDDQPALAFKYGDWHLFNLKSDATGTYASVDVLVHADNDETIPYRIELQRGTQSIKFASIANSNKVDIGNNSAPPKAFNLQKYNLISLNDWLMIAGILLLGLILIYLLVFRVLFRGLLFKRRWGVTSAEHFTWSMSLLLMLLLAAISTYFLLGPRLETYIIIAVMGAFWLLHAIVWMVSGKEA